MKLFVYLPLILEVTLAQMNGEFWWLNEKVAALKGSHAPPVVYGDLNDLGTDETDMVIFRDRDPTNIFEVAQKKCNNKKGKAIDERVKMKNGSVVPIYSKTELLPVIETTTSKSPEQETNEDVLVFRDFYNVTNGDNMQVLTNRRVNSTDEDEMRVVFPVRENTTSSGGTKNNSVINEHFLINHSNANNDNEWIKHEENKFDVESICTFVTIDQCQQKNGMIYSTVTITMSQNGNFKICCVLPLIIKENASRVIFPDKIYRKTSRKKRGTEISNDEHLENREKQRTFLVRLRSNTLRKLSTSSVKPLQKIVTPDYYEYEDPYWNVKNTKVNPTIINSDYDAPDYDEDFVSELPKPGRLGSYPAQSDKPLLFKWALLTRNIKQKGSGYNGPSYNDYDQDPVIDDRSEQNKYVQSSTSTRDDFVSEEEKDEIIDPIVRYTADPDFEVLKDFKLLNLVPKNKKKTKNKIELNISTTDNGETDSTQTKNNNYNPRSGFIRLYKDCGKSNKVFNNKGTSGEIQSESQPWLALVVRKGSSQQIVCYATLVHPRAAVTTANCLHGYETGELELIAGKWDLSDESTRPQRRVVYTYTDPKYRPESWDHDLAILYWNTPLRIDKNASPACLTAVNIEEDICGFIGWGGNDDEMSARPRWQRALLLSASECIRRLGRRGGSSLPRGALCATVDATYAVSGVGGALFCRRAGLQSVAGVVYRRAPGPAGPLLLLPVHTWVKQTLTQLSIF